MSFVIGREELAPLIKQLTSTALLHRNATGHRACEFAPEARITFDWRGGTMPETTVGGVELKLQSSTGKPFHCNERGLGITGGKVNQVDGGEALLISFNRDVLVESAGLIAGNGQCGGFYRIGEDGVTQDAWLADLVGRLLPSHTAKRTT